MVFVALQVLHSDIYHRRPGGVRRAGSVSLRIVQWARPIAGWASLTRSLLDMLICEDGTVSRLHGG